VSGEHRIVPEAARDSGGSSPRERGAPYGKFLRSGVQRIIPA